MSWQDLIIGIVCFIFAIVLVPQIYRVFKLKEVKNLSWITLIITPIGSATIAVVFLLMKCYISALNNFLIAGCWFLILVGKIIFGGRK